MPEDHPHYATEDIVNPETRHEESDVNVRALVWFGIIFIVFGFLTWLVVLFFFKALATNERKTAGETAPLSQIQRPADAAVPKNQPLLQPFPKNLPAGRPIDPHTDTPVTDLARMRETEKRVLDSYGWVDRQRGVVRVPIERAKEMIVQRGLPVQSQVPAPVPAITTTTTTGGAP